MDEAVPILLVDDQPLNLEALQAVLDATTCRFVLARSADEALLALLDQDFAAIVLDIRMPGMTGLELAKLIKGRKRTQHVPILFLTAHMIDERDALEGYGTGAVDYLTKPINPDVMRSKIAVFSELFRKSRALTQANEALQREVAERQRMEEALRESNQRLELRVEERTSELQDADRRKDEFLAALAHELRNPLAALHAAAEVFRIQTPPGSSLELPQGVILRQLRQMTRLVDDLLDVSRITRDKLILQPSRVDLSKVVSAALETSRPGIEQRGHRLTLRLPAEPVIVDADLVRLSQVFANLLDNAAKYTEPGGTIELTADQVSDEVVVRVADSGVGIDAAHLANIFDLFMQAERRPEHSHGGLGIGLTLVRRLVAMHGGSVSAHSEGRGKGSEFIVRIPMVRAGRSAFEALSLEPRDHGLEDVLRILIVEDNRDAAEMLNAMLASWGQDTRIAYDGLSAIEVAEELRPQVMLLDIGLPHLNGYDVARHIRQQAWSKDLLMVAVTGWGQEADKLRSSAAGIDHHLIKPVEPSTLKALLADFQALGVHAIHSRA